MTATPRNFNKASLSSLSLCWANLAIFGGGLSLLSFAVALHTKRCATVPGSAKQSWHDESVICQLMTLHFRVWVHWPPLMADTSEGAQVLDQGVDQLFNEALPLAMGAMTPNKSWRTDLLR